jgi:hypothetical protein
MMQYYVLKSATELFDLSLAYGLAGIIKEGAEEEDEVRLSDNGMYYLVSGPPPDELELKKFKAAIPVEENWRWVFFAQGKERSVAMRNEVSQILGDKQKMSALLKRHLEPYPVSISDKKDKSSVTLPQSLEPSATKGTRSQVRNKNPYNEGGNVSVPDDYWALSSLGLALFADWKDWRRPRKLITLLPVPDLKGIDISHAKGIRESFSKFKLWVNRVSTEACLAHAAMLLVKEIAGKRINDSRLTDRFSSIVFASSVKTGTQWKPTGGGVYPLEFLNHLSDATPQNSLDLFDFWDKMFRTGSVKGNEPLALTLAEFITRPSLESYEEYVRVQLRMYLNKKTHRLYEEPLLEEVTKHVNLN